MIWLLIILTVSLLFSIYANINLYKKYETLESISKELEIRLKENEEFITSIQSRVMSQRSYLKQLDNRGAFESDDEVGFFFKELKKIINDISTYFEDDDSDENSDKEEVLKKFNGRIV